MDTALKLSGSYGSGVDELSAPLFPSVSSSHLEVEEHAVPAVFELAEEVVETVNKLQVPQAHSSERS